MQLSIQMHTTFFISTFRLFKVALSADIQQMYRQVQINGRDKMFDLVLWRNSPSEEAGDDSFQYSIKLSDEAQSTKRTIVSDVARIFDPLGWISPTVIRANILIQDLWKKKLTGTIPYS